MKKRIGLVVLLLIGIVAASGIASAFFGFGGIGLGHQTADEIKQERQDMQNAIEAKDFSSWKTLMEDRLAKIEAGLTEDNFNRIVEMNENMTQRRALMKGNMDNIRKAQWDNESINKTWERPGPRGMFGKGCEKDNCPFNMTGKPDRRMGGSGQGIIGRIKGWFS